MEGLPPSPNARLYAYLIVHGMVRGALVTGQLPPATLPQILRLDHAAQDAVRNALEAHLKGGPQDMASFLPDREDAKADAAMAALLIPIESRETPP